MDKCGIVMKYLVVPVIAACSAIGITALGCMENGAGPQKAPSCYGNVDGFLGSQKIRHVLGDIPPGSIVCANLIIDNKWFVLDVPEIQAVQKVQETKQIKDIKTIQLTPLKNKIILWGISGDKFAALDVLNIDDSVNILESTTKKKFYKAKGAERKLLLQMMARIHNNKEKPIVEKSGIADGSEGIAINQPGDLLAGKDGILSLTRGLPPKNIIGANLIVNGKCFLLNESEIQSFKKLLTSATEFVLPKGIDHVSLGLPPNQIVLWSIKDSKIVALDVVRITDSGRNLESEVKVQNYEASNLKEAMRLKQKITRIHDGKEKPIVGEKLSGRNKGRGN